MGRRKAATFAGLCLSLSGCGLTQADIDRDPAVVLGWVLLALGVLAVAGVVYLIIECLS